MKKIEKLFIDLSKLIPEMKEEPLAWKNFLKKLVDKKPNSQMSPAFQKRLHQRVLQAIEKKNPKKVLAPVPMFWRNGFKLFYNLAGGFAILLLAGLPLIQNKYFPMVLTPVKTDQRIEKKPSNEVYNNEESTKIFTGKSDLSKLPQSVKANPQLKNNSDANLTNKIQNEEVLEQNVAPVMDVPLEPEGGQIDSDLGQEIIEERDGMGGGEPLSSFSSPSEPLPNSSSNDTLTTSDPAVSIPPSTATTPPSTATTPPAVREPVPEVTESELPPAQPVNLTQFIPQIITLARNFLVAQNIDLSRFAPPYLATSLQSPTLLRNALVVFTSFDPTKKNLTLQVNFEAGTVNFR